MQLSIQATGEAPYDLPEAVQAQAADYFQNNKNPTGHREWPALRRMLDRIDPGYKE